MKKFIIPSAVVAVAVGVGFGAHVVATHADAAPATQVTVSKDSLPVTNNESILPTIDPTAPVTTPSAAVATGVDQPVATDAPAPAVTPEPTPYWNPAIDTNPDVPTGPVDGTNGSVIVTN